MACARTDWLDPDEIKANLRTRRIGKKILVYRSTSSTNDVAAEYAKNRENDGLVVFAEEQTAGRGRSGRKWDSGTGDSILCSIVLREESPGVAEGILPPHLLSLVCAVAVAEAIGPAGAGSHAKIKWPNDILLNGRKVAGILLESKTDRHGSLCCILGIGINCHQHPDSFSDELRPTATSLDIESRSTIDRISLARRLLTCVDHWLEVAEKNSEKVTEKWCTLSIQLGHRTALIFNGVKFSGHCIGIDPEKGLILRLDAGGIRMFDAAHTTVAR
ncbi:MAG: biotin--[acetyl-CoA-carboxylase] ligase [Planctomycetota bacterium]|jgi:BirA family biotin operon repressor/biotin-[acetyl-CoA-carboxylase] ligase